jgi:hypothetical protein
MTDGDDVLVRIEPLLADKVRRRRGVKGEGGVADFDAAQEVEPSHPREPGEAVGGEGAVRALAVGPNAAAGEQVGLPPPHLDLPPGMADRVDHHLARTTSPGVTSGGRGERGGRYRRGGRGRLLDEGEGEHSQRH